MMTSTSIASTSMASTSALPAATRSALGGEAGKSSPPLPVSGSCVARVLVGRRDRRLQPSLSTSTSRSAASQEQCPLTTARHDSSNQRRDSVLRRNRCTDVRKFSRGLRRTTTMVQLKLEPPQGQGAGESFPNGRFDLPNGRLDFPNGFVESLEKQVEAQSSDKKLHVVSDEDGGHAARSSSSRPSGSVRGTGNGAARAVGTADVESSAATSSSATNGAVKASAVGSNAAAQPLAAAAASAAVAADKAVAKVKTSSVAVEAMADVKAKTKTGASERARLKASSETQLVVKSVKANSGAKKTGKTGAKNFTSKVETITQEDPWFKKAQDQKLKVSVVPGGRWNKFKTYSTIQRSFEIWSFVVKFALKWWLIQKKFTYRGGMTLEKQKGRRKELAKWLKEGLLRLGPTFIKLGQQFSTRVDVLAQEYVDELAELQDQVPPFESERAIEIVEKQLGGKVDEIFERFDREPIAAASLGQVHRARLKGEEVVVKVQRPDLKELFDIDLKNLRVLAVNLQKVDPKSDGAKRDWVAIYDECAEVLYQEIDYRREGENAERFRKNFQAMDWVKAPSIYWDYTTEKVLTMEYVPGIKINRIDALDELGVDRKRLGRLTVESYLEQILRHGFFHADPHPGNIAVDDVGGGRLIFYDFGMMGVINPGIREGLLEAFYGVYERDADKVLEAMVQMGVLVPTGDMVSVRRTAQFFLNSFDERLAAQKAEKAEAERQEKELGFKKELSKEEKMEKKKQRLAAIGEDLLSIAVDQPFRFPATFTFVVRAFSVLDGIGKGLDPRFDISEIARPYALELLKLREAGYDYLVKDLKKRWNRQARAFQNLFRGPDRVARLEAIVTRLEQGDLKLRVRTLESERAFKRVAVVQNNLEQAIILATCLNVGTILYVNAMRVPATVSFVVSAFCGLQLFLGSRKVKKLDQMEAQITGTG